MRKGEKFGQNCKVIGENFYIYFSLDWEFYCNYRKYLINLFAECKFNKTNRKFFFSFLWTEIVEKYFRKQFLSIVNIFVKWILFFLILHFISQPNKSYQIFSNLPLTKPGNYVKSTWDKYWLFSCSWKPYYFMYNTYIIVNIIYNFSI